jgi:S-DNA-T family DNA segregation ATPase FtsK/SpoIIIE
VLERLRHFENFRESASMQAVARSRNSRARPAATPVIRLIIQRRLAELAGLVLGSVALLLLIALVSYDPNDPSFDTATSRHAVNLSGPAGAFAADLLLQSFGVAGVLPGLAWLAWAWRIATHRGIRRIGLRLLALLLALPLGAATISALPLPGTSPGVPWPTGAGLGGAFGGAFSNLVMPAALAAGGAVGAGLVLAAGVGLAGLLSLFAVGLSVGEWRAAGQGASGAARLSFRRIRRVCGMLRRLSQHASELVGPPPVQAVVPPPDQRRPDPDLIQPSGAAQPPARALLEEIAPPVVEKPAVRARVAAARRVAEPRQEVLPLVVQPQSGWRFPSLSLLAAAPARAGTGPSEEALQANARLLETVLADYGVQGVIRDIRPGPVVTLYELEPAPGIRSARVIGLADDVARSLSVTAVRIATVSGRNVIGIEVPNARRETVFLSELLCTEEWARHPGRLVLALGKDISGSPVAADLARMPHMLIAGTTGSGKSVGVNAMILSLLYRLSPEECRLILIDPKMLELSVYEGIPHLMAPVVTEPAKAVVALKWTVREMERRYRAMSQLSVRNIGGYNERVSQARAKGEVVSRRVQVGFDSETSRPIFEEQPLALEVLPLIVVVIDEMADLMMVAGKEIEAAVQRLAQMARAAGIHVIAATQRPSVDVITGTIKANFPTRISFQVISKFDSRTILGEQGAEQLLGQGDMLHMIGGGRITRVHGPFVSDQEVEHVVAFLRTQGEPAYVEEVTEAVDDEPGLQMSGIAGASDGEKGLFDQAVALVAREGKASTSFIQRHLQIGYNRAAKLIEQMEKEGIVSPANHVGRRDVLVRRDED